MAKEKENTQNLKQDGDVSLTLNMTTTNSQHDKGKEQQDKDKVRDVSATPQNDNKTENKGNNENAAQNTQNEYKSLETYKNSLNPQEKKILEKFMSSPVFDSFVTYLETFFRDKDTIIHRINCYCFRAKENVNIRIHGKIYEIKQNEVIYIQKDSFGNAMLRNDKLERIL